MFRTRVAWLIFSARRLLGIPYARWVFFAKRLGMVFVASGTISRQAEAVICEKDNKQDKRGKVLHREGAFEVDMISPTSCTARIAQTRSQASAKRNNANPTVQLLSATPVD